jgi:hypothetical protein
MSGIENFTFRKYAAEKSFFKSTWISVDVEFCTDIGDGHVNI